MNKKKRNLIITVVVIIVFFIAVALLYNNLTGKENTEVENVPEETVKELLNIKEYDFTVENTSGESVSLSEIAKGKNVVLNFWASWCPPCKAEMPYFKSAEKHYEDKGVTFFMIDLVNSKETKEAGKSYLEDNGFDFKNVLFDVDGEAGYIYGIASIPTTIVINTNGDIVNGKAGAFPSEQSLRDFINGNLNIN